MKKLTEKDHEAIYRKIEAFNREMNALKISGLLPDELTLECAGLKDATDEAMHAFREYGVCMEVSYQDMRDHEIEQSASWNQ